MQVTINVTRTFSDGNIAYFTASSDSIQGAIDAAHQLVNGPEAAAGSEGAVAATPAAEKAAPAKKEPKKEVAETASAPSTATAQTKKPEATVKEMPGVSYDDVKASILAVSKAKGREPTVAMLQRFGVASGKDLTADQFPAVIAMAEKILAGTYDPMDGEVRAEDDLS